MICTMIFAGAMNTVKEQFRGPKFLRFTLTGVSPESRLFMTKTLQAEKKNKDRILSPSPPSAMYVHYSYFDPQQGQFRVALQPILNGGDLCFVKLGCQL